MQFSQPITINVTAATIESTEKRGVVLTMDYCLCVPPCVSDPSNPQPPLPPPRSDQVHRTKPPPTNPPYLSKRPTIKLPNAPEKAEGNDECEQEM